VAVVGVLHIKLQDCLCM